MKVKKKLWRRGKHRMRLKLSERSLFLKKFFFTLVYVWSFNSSSRQQQEPQTEDHAQKNHQASDFRLFLFINVIDDS